MPEPDHDYVVRTSSDPLSTPFTTLADWASWPEPDDLPTADDIADLRDGLAAELAAIVGPWPNRPAGPLRITKRRLRTMALCPAQELAAETGASLGFNLAAGVVCDLAAGLLSVNPRFPAEGGWLVSMRDSIRYERPELIDFIDGLSPAEHEEFDALVDERCRELPTLLGDVSGHWPTSHERLTVRFGQHDRSGEETDAVVLNAELDLGVGREARVLAEIKTGQFSNWLPEEVRHYGLLTALRDGKAAKVGVAITLKDRRLTPVSLGLGELQLAAERVLSTASALVAVDQAVLAGRPVPTVPGDHCQWCPRATDCHAVSDLVLAGLEGT